MRFITVLILLVATAVSSVFLPDNPRHPLTLKANATGTDTVMAPTASVFKLEERAVPGKTTVADQGNDRRDDGTLLEARGVQPPVPTPHDEALGSWMEGLWTGDASPKAGRPSLFAVLFLSAAAKAALFSFAWDRLTEDESDGSGIINVVSEEKERLEDREEK